MAAVVTVGPCPAWDGDRWSTAGADMCVAGDADGAERGEVEAHQRLVIGATVQLVTRGGLDGIEHCRGGADLVGDRAGQVGGKVLLEEDRCDVVLGGKVGYVLQSLRGWFGGRRNAGDRYLNEPVGVGELAEGVVSGDEIGSGTRGEARGEVGVELIEGGSVGGQVGFEGRGVAGSCGAQGLGHRGGHHPHVARREPDVGVVARQIHGQNPTPS